MNRLLLQQLCEERVRNAEVLLQAGEWSGVYYLIGYAVECALKSCIAKQVNQYDYPNKDLAQRCFTHNLEDLVKVAELVLQRQNDMNANPVLAKNWLIVKNWDEKTRYKLWSEPQARSLFMAVTDPNNGVLSWIKVHW